MAFSFLTQSHRQRGFTLIEMLVTVGIGLLLATLGITGYIRFNDRQKILNSTRELETIFQTAAVKAQGGDLGGCTQLAGYRVTVATTVDPVTATLSSICQDGTVTTVSSYTLVNGIGVSFVPGLNYIDFPVLQGGVIFNPSATSVTATFTNTALNLSYAVDISRGGDFNEGIWQ